MKEERRCAGEGMGQGAMKMRKDLRRMEKLSEEWGAWEEGGYGRNWRGEGYGWYGNEEWRYGAEGMRGETV